MIEETIRLFVVFHWMFCVKTNKLYSINKEDKHDNLNFYLIFRKNILI
jgi:hypothetical protein